jgi:hypothetical protein
MKFEEPEWAKLFQMQRTQWYILFYVYRSDMSVLDQIKQLIISQEWKSATEILLVRWFSVFLIVGS